jgi:hypothetical protein
MGMVAIAVTGGQSVPEAEARALGFVGARILEAAGIFLAVASLLTTGYSTMAVCTATEAYRPAQHTKPQHGVGTGTRHRPGGRHGGGEGNPAGSQPDNGHRPTATAVDYPHRHSWTS